MMWKVCKKENKDMTTKDRTNTTVVAIFPDDAQARQSIEALHRAGYREDQITYSGHAAASGGWLANLKSFFTGEDASTTSGAYRDMINMGMPEEDAQAYAREYEAGRSIVAVYGGRSQEAQSLLAQHGGYAPERGTTSTDYEQTGKSGRTAGYERSADYGRSADKQRDTTNVDTDEARRMQLRSEQLRVYKQPVQSGEVGIHKEIVSEQKNIDVPVSHEEVYVERRPGTGEVSDTPIGENESLRMPVNAEQVQVDKQTVNTGEVVMGKREVQGTQRVSDTVRHEEARVERSGDVDIQGDKRDVDLQGDDPNRYER
jgi:uncharacterized protein (TIGR02271 family)